MSEENRSQEGEGHKRLVASVFLVLIGVVIGITWVSEWLPQGEAENIQQPPQAKPPVLSHAGRTFVEISKSVTPAVVNISSTRVVHERDNFSSSPFEDPLFRHFFGRDFFRNSEPRQRKERGLGSGVIVSEDGLIITNNHVINKADQIRVVLSDKREFDGKVIGSDPKSDLAVVRIGATRLPTIPWADSDLLEVGEYVLAIGNPFGLTQTVTMGIVSAVGRANVGVADYEDFIQTDAAINPGNSGGALVNTRGELVGINTAIFTQSGGYMGIGFAVPSDMARSVLESLVKSGKVIRGWLGISIQDVTPQLAQEFGLDEAKGALIAEILPNSPAKSAGLQQGDILLSVMGQPIESASQLRNLIARIPAKTQVTLVVLRDRKEKTFSVKIEEQPKEIAEGNTVETPEDDGRLSGVNVQELTPSLARRWEIDPHQEGGVVVTDIEEDSPAAESGLMRGDLIVEINRHPIRDVADYRSTLSRVDSGRRILLLIQRGGKMFFLSIAPEEQ